MVWHPACWIIANTGHPDNPYFRDAYYGGADRYLDMIDDLERQYPDRHAMPPMAAAVHASLLMREIFCPAGRPRVWEAGFVYPFPRLGFRMMDGRYKDCN